MGSLDPRQLAGLQQQYNQTRGSYGRYTMDPRYNGGYDERSVRGALDFAFNKNMGSGGTIGGVLVDSLGLNVGSSSWGTVTRFDTAFGGAGGGVLRLAMDMDPGGMAAKLHVKAEQAQRDEIIKQQQQFYMQQQQAYMARAQGQQQLMAQQQAKQRAQQQQSQQQMGMMMMMLVLVMALQEEENTEQPTT